MPATLETSPEAAPENAVLSKPQKLAALLVMLGTESAAVVLRQFQPREIEAISREMARFNLITREQQQEILREFSDVAVAASTSVSAGVEVTRNTLERAFGSFKASDMMGRVASTRAPLGAMQVIADMDPRHIFNLVRDEQAQAIDVRRQPSGAGKGRAGFEPAPARSARPGDRAAGHARADAGGSRRKSRGRAQRQARRQADPRAVANRRRHHRRRRAQRDGQDRQPRIADEHRGAQPGFVPGHPQKDVHVRGFAAAAHRRPSSASCAKSRCATSRSRSKRPASR